MLIFTPLISAYAQSATFDLGSPFLVQGDADVRSNRIELIDGYYGELGAAWVDSAFELPQDGGFHATFEVTLDGASFGGGGFVFALQGEGPDALGATTAGLGYEGISPSVAVELDLWESFGNNDPDDNHVGINLDGSVTSDEVSAVPFDLDGGNSVYGRVDYVLGELSVSVDTVPPDGSAPLLTLSVDMPTGPLWVGFTATTGQGSARTVWDFSFQADADSDADGLLDFEDPEPGTETLPGESGDTGETDTDGPGTDTGDPGGTDTDTDQPDTDGPGTDDTGLSIDTGPAPDGQDGTPMELDLPRVFFCGCAQGPPLGPARAGLVPLMLLLVALRRLAPQRSVQAGE